MDRSSVPKMTWNMVKAAIESNQLELLGRSPSQLETYRAFRRRLAEEWRSLGDYVYVHKFGFSKERNDDGKFTAVKPVPTPHQIFISENDFPYNLEDGEDFQNPIDF